MSRPHQPLSFLDLPVEIRLQIYQHHITSFSWGPALHINLTSQFNPLYPPSLGSGQLTYTPCLSPNQSLVPSPLNRISNTMDLFRYHTHYETCKGWHIRNGTPPALQGTYLSMFLTCRTIHQEAIHLIYALHSFTTHSLPTLYQFLILAPHTSLSHLTTLNITLTIPPTYLSPPPPSFYHGIDTAHSQWITCTFLLSRLACLSFLRITIYNATYRRFHEDQMLLPLRSVRVKEGGSFTVFVPFQEPTISGILSTSPVKGSGGGGTPPISGAGVGMTISRRPRNHEPAIEPTFLEANVNTNLPFTPTSRRRRRRRYRGILDSWMSREDWLGVAATVCCCPFVFLAMLWDVVVGRLVVWVGKSNSP